MRSPVKNFHFSWDYWRIYSLFIYAYMKSDRDFFWAYSKCWDLNKSNFYLEFLRVCANISRFFYLRLFIVSVFLAFYCKIFSSFSIIYFYFKSRLLWALINFYWLDFFELYECDRFLYLCSLRSLWLWVIFLTVFLMYFCYFYFKVWLRKDWAW